MRRVASIFSFITFINQFNGIQDLCRLDLRGCFGEFEKYWKAIEQNEKWEIGDEEPIDKWIIEGVHKTRAVISEYKINTGSTSVWFAKDKALDMAREGRLQSCARSSTKWHLLFATRIPYTCFCKN